MKKITLLLCLSFPLAFLTAQSDTTKSELQLLLENIESEIDSNRIPGLMLTLVTKDSVIYDGGLGMANLEEERPVDATQLFRLGSITKSFAALAMLRLEAEGKFSLKDKLAEVAPEVPFENRWKESHPVLLVHLLEHAAGFDDMHFNAVYNWEKREKQTLDMVHLHKNSLKCRWKPGTRMAYSNPCYVIIGYLIEKFSGKSYHDYVKEIIFDPIGMEHTNMTSFPDMQLHAKGYKHEGGDFQPIPFYAIHGGIAGTLNSCGKDMARFLQFFLNDGTLDSVEIFPKRAIDKMEIPTGTLAARMGRTGDYALGNRLSYLRKSFAFQGHGGGIDGFSSIYGYNRALGVGFAMSNNANGNMREIEEMVINFLTKENKPPERHFIELEEDFAKQYEGYFHYANPRNQVFYFIENLFGGVEVFYRGDTLLVKGFMEPEEKYLKTGENLFRRVDFNTPSLVLATDDTGNEVVIGNGYYEKSSRFAIKTKRVWFFTALALSFGAVLFALVWFILLLAKKTNPKFFALGSSVAASAFGLALFVIGFLVTVEDFTTIGQFHFMNLCVYLGSLIFSIGAMVAIFNLVKNWPSMNKGLFKYYLAISAISLFSLAFYLFQHNWIGMKLWTY